jgi:hypothetical protein
MSGLGFMSVFPAISGTKNHTQNHLRNPDERIENPEGETRERLFRSILQNSSFEDSGRYSSRLLLDASGAEEGPEGDEGRTEREITIGRASLGGTAGIQTASVDRTAEKGFPQWFTLVRSIALRLR